MNPPTKEILWLLSFALLWIELNVPEAILQLEQLQKEVPAKRANDSCGDCRWNQRRKYPIWPWIRSHWEKDYLPNGDRCLWVANPANGFTDLQPFVGGPFIARIISKQRMFAGFVGEIFLIFGIQTKAIKAVRLLRLANSVHLLDLSRKSIWSVKLWGLPPLPFLKAPACLFSGFRYQADTSGRYQYRTTPLTPSAGGQRRKECTPSFPDTTYIIHNHQKFTSTIPKSSCTTNVTTSTQWYVGVHTVVHGETYDLIHMQVSICAPGPLWVKFFLI